MLENIYNTHMKNAPLFSVFLNSINYPCKCNNYSFKHNAVNIYYDIKFDIKYAKDDLIKNYHER